MKLHNKLHKIIFFTIQNYNSVVCNMSHGGTVKVNGCGIVQAE